MAGLAARLYLGGAATPRRYFAWGQAARNAVLAAVLPQARRAGNDHLRSGLPGFLGTVGEPRAPEARARPVRIHDRPVPCRCGGGDSGHHDGLPLPGLSRHQRRRQDLASPQGAKATHKRAVRDLPAQQESGSPASPDAGPAQLTAVSGLTAARRAFSPTLAVTHQRGCARLLTASSVLASTFCARPVRFGPRAEVIRLAPGDPLAPPGTTGPGLRLFWPQRHGTPGSRPDRGAVQFGAGLGNAVLHPGPDQGHWPVGRQRVNPEVPVLAATAATAPALLQDQAPVIVIVRRPVVHAGGGRAAAIGIQNAQPQLVIIPRGATPGSVPFEGIGVASPTGLSLAAQADMEGELEPVRVGADTADGYGHLLSADQHHLGRDRRGDHRIRTHPSRTAVPDWLRWRRLRDRFKKAHAIRLAPFTAIGDQAATARSRRKVKA